MKKKILSIALVFMLGASVLAGCGQKEAEEPAVKQTQESEPASEEKNTEEKAETENSELSGKITFWTTGDKSNTNDHTYPWMEENIKLFEEKYPGCEVEATFIASGEDYLTKITTEVAAGNAPDVFRTYLTGRLQPFVDGGKVLPIEHMLETYPETKGIMNDKALALSTFDGKAYAIPLIASGEMFFYNKKIFAECGAEIPKTYDELLALVDLFNEKGITPCMLGISDPWPGTIPYMMIFNRLNGNGLYEKVVLNKEADFANDAFVNAGKYLQEIVNRKMFNESIVAISQEEAGNKFKAGESAMIIDGSWSVPGYAETLGEDVGIFNFPEIEGGTGSSDDWLMNFDEGFAISSGTKNQPVAEAFLAFIFSPERQAAYAETGALIACKNVNYDTSKISALTTEVLDPFESAAYSIIPWDNPLGTDVGQELNNTTQAIITGGDPQKEFEKLQEYAEDAWGE